MNNADSVEEAALARQRRASEICLRCDTINPPGSAFRVGRYERSNSRKETKKNIHCRLS